MSIKLFKPNKNDTEDLNVIHHLDHINKKKKNTVQYLHNLFFTLHAGA